MFRRWSLRHENYLCPSATTDVYLTLPSTLSRSRRAFWGADYEEISEGGMLRVIVLGFRRTPATASSPTGTRFYIRSSRITIVQFLRMRDEREPYEDDMSFRLRNSQFHLLIYYCEYLDILLSRDPERDQVEFEDDETEGLVRLSILWTEGKMIGDDDDGATTLMAPTTRRGPNTPVNDTNPNNMTPESIQAMIDQALLRNSTNGDGSHSSHGDNRRNVQTTRPCFYADFMKCQPLNFKGAEGVSAALTWWNGQIRTLGPEAYAMTWEVLKRKMTDKYCPQGEIKKLEIELWNLKVKGNDVPAYTERFQELTLICTKFVANETEKVDKYLSGLPDNIYGNVKAAKPKTLDAY
ncbi:putative reverse transcriptase domain-containing protein [Tanacetum coccineum]